MYRKAGNEIEKITIPAKFDTSEQNFTTERSIQFAFSNLSKSNDSLKE